MVGLPGLLLLWLFGLFDELFEVLGACFGSTLNLICIASLTYRIGEDDLG